MKNLTWQNPEQLFVAQELINKVKSKCCGIKGELTPPGCKMNRLGELAYIPQLDEVTLQVEKDFALVGKLGVEQLDIQTMSGGEETRLKIAQALSAQVHGILADEPTSHLDREGIDCKHSIAFEVKS